MSAAQPKILLVTTFHPEFLDDVYEADSELGGLAFDAQSRRLFAADLGVADAYVHGLGALGCEAHAVVVNADRLQRRWAEEHDVALTGNIHDRRRRIIAAQVDHFGPEVLYVFEWSPLGDAFLNHLKPRVPLLVTQLASNLLPDRTFDAYDLALSSWSPLVEHFRSKGLAAESFALGFDERVLSNLGSSAPRYDVTFVGGLGPAHQNRIEWIERLLRETDIDVFGYGYERTPTESPIRRHHHGPVWGWSMYQTLRQSRITLNMHGSIRIHGHDRDEREDRERILGPARRDSVPRLANNLRLYEATGVGTCLLTDARDNLSDMFEPGREVLTFVNEADCLAKIRHYLQHEHERREIAQAGQRRTLRDHTCARRMAELLEILRAHLGKPVGLSLAGG